MFAAIVIHVSVYGMVTSCAVFPVRSSHSIDASWAIQQSVQYDSCIGFSWFRVSSTRCLINFGMLSRLPNNVPLGSLSRKRTKRVPKHVHPVGNCSALPENCTEKGTLRMCVVSRRHTRTAKAHDIAATGDSLPAFLK